AGGPLLPPRRDRGDRHHPTRAASAQHRVAGRSVMTADPLHALLDHEAIKSCKARYFRHMDAKNWFDWGLVFTEDAHMEVPEAGMVVDGRAAIVNQVSSALQGTRTVHHGHMPEIELTGRDTARGIWSMEDYVEFPN